MFSFWFTKDDGYASLDIVSCALLYFSVYNINYCKTSWYLRRIRRPISWLMSCLMDMVGHEGWMRSHGALLSLKVKLDFLTNAMHLLYALVRKSGFMKPAPGHARAVARAQPQFWQRRGWRWSKHWFTLIYLDPPLLSSTDQGNSRRGREPDVLWLV